jgi:hypothetical protein
MRNPIAWAVAGAVAAIGLAVLITGPILEAIAHGASMSLGLLLFTPLAVVALGIGMGALAERRHARPDIRWHTIHDERAAPGFASELGQAARYMRGRYPQSPPEVVPLPPPPPRAARGDR